MATRLCWRAATGHTVTATNSATSSIDRATAAGITDTAFAELPTSPPGRAQLLLVHRVPAANRPAPSLAQPEGAWPSPARVSRLVTLRQPPSPGCSTVPEPPLRSIERPHHQRDQYPVELPRVEHGTKPSAHAAGSAMRSHVTCARGGWRVSALPLRLEWRLVGAAAAAEFGHAALLSA